MGRDVRSDEQFLPETDLSFPLNALTLTGQYLGDLTSFVYRRVQAEADALFANGDPTGDDLTQSLSQRIKFLIKEKRHELPA